MGPNPSLMVCNISPREARGEKKALREELRRRRAGVWPELVAGWSAAVCGRVAGLETWRGAETVQLFVGALAGEVRTEALLRRGLADGKTMICPRVLGQGRLEQRRVTSVGQLTRSRRGLLEPEPRLTELADASAAELILVPGLAFDPRGGRLGLGGGYYDRFLATTDGVRLGLAFEWQLLSRIPVQQHDQGVDAIVTELRVLEVARSRE